MHRAWWWRIRFPINRIPDVFFALKVTVQSTFRQFGGIQDIADGGVEIPFDGKQLQRGIDDSFTGSVAFVRHDIAQSYGIETLEGNRNNTDRS